MSTLSYDACVLDPYTIVISDEEWHPRPDDFQTTTVMDIGSWGGPIGTRMGNFGLSAPELYATNYEWDFGAFDLPALSLRNVYGATFLSPQLAAQTTGAIRLRHTMAWKNNGGSGYDLRGALCIYQWNANDTLGTVYGNRLVTSILTPTYANYAPNILVGGGITLNAGDRICVDFWLEVEETGGTNKSGRFGYARWGDTTYPGFLRFQLSNLRPLQGISVPSQRWGVL